MDSADSRWFAGHLLVWNAVRRNATVVHEAYEYDCTNATPRRSSPTERVRPEWVRADGGRLPCCRAHRAVR